MTPNLILLNVSSLALVCVLALFARHNKKVGWVKTRSTFVEDLRALRQDWAEQDDQAALPHVMPQAMEPAVGLDIKAPLSSPITQTNFAAQLASLHTALKETGPRVEVSDRIAEAKELVA